MKDQRKRPRSERITFTPLSGHRLRCNWNGAVIPKRQRKAANSRRWNEVHPGNHNPSSPKAKTVCLTAYQVQKAEISRDGKRVECPYCRWQNSGSRSNPIVIGDMYCNSCNRRFVAFAPPPLKEAPWMRWHVGSKHGSVICPHCQIFQDGRFAGEIKCNKCNVVFLAVEKTIEPLANPTPSLTVLRAYNMNGDIDCPQCGRIILDEVTGRDPVTLTCWCGVKFTALPYDA